MAWLLLLLSDQADDARDVLPELPVLPYRVEQVPLKTTGMDKLIALHPDILLIDATVEIEGAEEATKKLSLAWEIGLPPIIVVLNETGVGRFRLEHGADDFIMSTASAGEISTRLAEVARRAGRGEESAALKVGDLTVNPDNYQVYLRGRPLDLTYKEFELLRFLAQRPGRVCDRDLLLRDVWGYDYYGGTRTVDVHIRRLRAKFGPEHEALIETVRNVGYRLVPRPRDR
ncbi:MAG: winged helix-turn-helix domain-containing protein [Actinomycetota bacterium]